MRIYNYRIKNKASAPSAGTKVSILRTKIKLPFKFRRSKRLWTLVFRAFALGILLLAILFLYYAKDLPDPNKLLSRQLSESTKIFDREGGLIYEIHGEAKRTMVSLDQISEYVKNATVAVEDKDFYSHHGLYVKGILRSVFRYVINFGPEGGGGSTLTQQFVKNAILTNQKSFDRKIREAILSLEIEARFSKEDILKLYLNEIPYGRNAYGIEAAAQSYFGKSAKDLNLAESAYLAALPQAPTYYNPLGPNRYSLDKRKDLVLSDMKQQGYITEEQEKQAKSEKVQFLKTKTAINAPHFVLMVQDYLANKYGEKTLAEGGLKVYTTLDPRIQKIAEEAVKTGAENNAKKYNAFNAALVAIDPKTGQILALVGSKNFFGEPEPNGCTPGKNCKFEPNVNAALSQLQPGSSFKPYVYVTAFGRDYKFSPSTMLMDVVTNFGVFGDKEYIPQDYDGKERGPISVRGALAGSLNIPAVKTLALIGVDNAVGTAHSLGITSPLANCGLSLVLGGCEVKLIDHVAAYSVLANGGQKNEKTAILKILNKDGNILEEYKQEPKPVLDPQAVYQLINIMTDNSARSFIFGANSPLTLPDRPVAAKTGTTQNWHDGWTLGFTPSLAAGVWAGNNNGELLNKNADGVLVAAPIWHKFMAEALKNQPVEQFSAPPEIVSATVDTVSGKLPTANTPLTKQEIFADYNLPAEYDNVHISLPYDSSTNLPADSSTLPEKIIYKAFTIFHSEMPDNPLWEEAVKNWAAKNGYTYPTNEKDAFIPKPISSGLQISFNEPKEGGKIDTIPFPVNLVSDSSNSISRMDLFIDGQFYQSIGIEPFNFIVSKSLEKGPHILAAKAMNSQGKTGDTSIEINVGGSNGLNLISPAGGGLAIFPLTLTAESSNNFAGVNFYYQSSGSSEPVRIGDTQTAENIGGNYRYTFRWDNPPDIKTFTVFARSMEGTETKKIVITIP